MKHSDREKMRAKAEKSAADRKQQRSEGFKPNNDDRVPDQSLTVAKAQRR